MKEINIFLNRHKFLNTCRHRACVLICFKQALWRRAGRCIVLTRVKSRDATVGGGDRRRASESVSEMLPLSPLSHASN